jgi:hypothetical protein
MEEVSAGVEEDGRYLRCGIWDMERGGFREVWRATMIEEVECEISRRATVGGCGLRYS